MEIPPYREPGSVGDLWWVAEKEEGGWELKGLQGLRGGHEVQDIIPGMRAKWTHSTALTPENGLFCKERKDLFWEDWTVSDFDLWRRDRDIHPVVSNYSLLLAAPAALLILVRTFLRKSVGLGPVFEEINDKAAQFPAKVFCVFFFDRD